MLGISAKSQSRSLIVFYLFHVWAGFSIFAHDIGYFSIANRSPESENDGFDIKHAITMFKEAIRNISDYLGEADTGPPMPPKCLRVQCRIICTNGRQGEIAQDISLALASPDNSDPCDIIDELYLYNYRFSNAVLPVGFLSTYTNRIKQLYLGISNIQDIENGAFGGGIFKRITLEDLHLNKIDKEFLANVSGDLKGISIIQHNRALECVYPDFLDYVMYQLEYLRLQVGIDCVRNVTGTDPILGALTYADFSYNNFTDQLLKDTFIKLTMVETLILSHSNIEYLPNYIFQVNTDLPI
ncbi:uncharacterized protein [Drosophila virilis]|uniref:uncharacterized protein n=1 Tax=Drosophila virilis TaxID=7244 RepID=UPI0038B32B57